MLIFLIGNLANLLYVVGSLFKKILTIRIFTIIASATDIVYRYYLTGGPQSSDIIWDLLWMIVNIVQAFLIIHERLTLKLSDENKRIHQMSFKTLSEINFQALVRSSLKQIYHAEEYIVKNQTKMDRLMVISTGLVDILKDGKSITQLRDGSLIGEMSFITGNLTSADVKALEDTTVLYWEKEKLEKLMLKNPEIALGLQSVLNKDLTSKLNK